MSGTRYRLHGLNISSDVSFPEPEESATTPPDLTICRHDDAVVPPLECDLHLRYAVGGWVSHEGKRLPDGRWLLHAPGRVAMMTSTDARHLDVWRDPAVPEEMIPLLVAGMGIAFVLTVRRLLCLHASAFEVGDGCIAIAAPSGGGKTTLAALASAAGSPFFADDVLRVDVDEQPSAFRGACEARLRTASAPVAEHWPEQSRISFDQRVAVAPPRSGFEQLPVTAVVLPQLDRDRADPDDVRVERLRGQDALVPLLECQRLLGWREPTLVATQFDQLVALAKNVPVLGVTVPWRERPGVETGEALVRSVLDATGRT